MLVDTNTIASITAATRSFSAEARQADRVGMYVMPTFLEVNGIRGDCTAADLVQAAISPAAAR